MKWTLAEQKEHRQALIKELREGGREQTTGVLRRKDSITFAISDITMHEYPAGYCCLGVACDLSGLGEWGEYDQEKLYGTHKGAMSYLTNSNRTLPDCDVNSVSLTGQVMPREVRDYYGFKSAGGHYWEDGENSGTITRALTSDNDDGVTFAEIAQTIEDEPSGLVITEADVDVDE
jgi:hypothetical protein